MAYEIINTLDHSIFKEKEGPFISIYQTTHREPSNNEQDAIRFKNLIKEAEKKMEKAYPKAETSKRLEPLYEIEKDTPFWNHTQEGLAVFSSPKRTVAFLFSQPLKETAVISDALYTLPLIRMYQTLDEYHVLALSKQDFRLFTGNRNTVDEVIFDGNTSTTKEEVLGKPDTENLVTHGSYGAKGGAQFHGHEDSRDVEEEDLERFFRYVDQFVHERYTKTTNDPLILWALPEYQGVFRSVSHNPNLLDQGVRKSTKHLHEDTVRDDTWALMEPKYKRVTNALIERYHNALHDMKGADVLQDIFKAASQGRVDTVLIEEGRTIFGYLDAEGRPVIINDPQEQARDLLDTITKRVMDQGGAVKVIDKEKMPTTTGVAAIYRY